MSFTAARFRLRSSLLIVALAGLGVAAVPSLLPQPFTPRAEAQERVSLAEFQEALDPYGQWAQHPRWGEVWVPDVDPDWQPYTIGRWAYTDEWGWFWESDEDFGWIVYHYGRWVRDTDLGWVWIPGEVWGPAWVQWRHNPQHIGWAPLPPDDVIVEYESVPDYWVFVGARDFGAPHVAHVILPRRERAVFIQNTVIVNRTVFIDRGPRIAVNPGIEPRIVAAGIGRPIRVAAVRPAVLRGTVGVEGARVVRVDRQRRQRVRAEISERRETIAPADRVRRLEPLARGERGRLGDRPPRAAREQARRFDAPSERQRLESERRPGRDGIRDGRRERDVKEEDSDSRRARRTAPDAETPDATRERPGRDRDDARTRTLRPDGDRGPRQRGEGRRDQDETGPRLRERGRPDLQERARPERQERARPDRGLQPPGGEQARPDRSPPNRIERGPGRPDGALRRERSSEPNRIERGPDRPDRALRQERSPGPQRMERSPRSREFGRDRSNGARERMRQERAPQSRAGSPASPRTISPPGSSGRIERAPARGGDGRDRRREERPGFGQ